MAAKKQTYEQAMKRLEEIVSRIDSNELDIDSLSVNLKEGKKQSNTNQRAVGLNMAFNGVYTNRYTNSLEVELL